MQTAVPNVVDASGESAKTHRMYGTDSGPTQSFGRLCMTARRLVESGVRFVQIFHMGWDSHGHLEREHKRQCGMIDRPTAALLRDLKRRGLLDETLVIWGGEFGRTPVLEGRSPTKGCRAGSTR